MLLNLYFTYLEKKNKVRTVEGTLFNLWNGSQITNIVFIMNQLGWYIGQLIDYKNLYKLEKCSLRTINLLKY